MISAKTRRWPTGYQGKKIQATPKTRRWPAGYQKKELQVTPNSLSPEFIATKWSLDLRKKNDKYMHI